MGLGEAGDHASIGRADVLPLRTESGELQRVAAQDGEVVCRGALTRYPDRPVMMFVGYARKSATDFAARLLAQALTETLGGSYIVINNLGVGGLISAAVFRAGCRDMIQTVRTTPGAGYTIRRWPGLTSPSTVSFASRPSQRRQPASRAGRRQWQSRSNRSPPAQKCRPGNTAGRAR